jgi:hypothetical protein
LCEEPGESAADDPDTPTGDGSDTGLMMQMRSQRLRRENGKPSEGRKDAAPSTDGQGISGIPAANAIAATTQKETKDQSAEQDLGSKDAEASRTNTANSHIHNQSPSTTKINKTKHRISQKSKNWFREPLKQLKRMLKR